MNTFVFGSGQISRLLALDNGIVRGYSRTVTGSRGEIRRAFRNNLIKHSSCPPRREKLPGIYERQLYQEWQAYC